MCSARTERGVAFAPWATFPITADDLARTATRLDTTFVIITITALGGTPYVHARDNDVIGLTPDDEA